MSRCPDCGARIVWTETATGVSFPVDPVPGRGGTLTVEPGDDSRSPPMAFFIRRGQHVEEGRRFKSHLATCAAGVS